MRVVARLDLGTGCTVDPLDVSGRAITLPPRFLFTFRTLLLTPPYISLEHIREYFQWHARSQLVGVIRNNEVTVAPSLMSCLNLLSPLML